MHKRLLRSSVMTGVIAGRLKLQILKSVVTLVLIPVVNDFTWTRNNSGMPPINKHMLITIGAAISLARIVHWRDYESVRTILHNTLSTDSMACMYRITPSENPSR